MILKNLLLTNTSFNKLFVEGKIDLKLINYLPKPQKRETYNEKIRNISSRSFS